MAKPTGAICNLACSYCFFLDKELLYEGDRFRMSDEMLERYIVQLIDAHQAPDVTIAWQGGEPTLMGVDFYRRALQIREAAFGATSPALAEVLRDYGRLLRRTGRAAEADRLESRAAAIDSAVVKPGGD